MDYRNDILTRLLDQYEARKHPSERPLSLTVSKAYPAYGDLFQDVQGQIDTAIAQLCAWGLVRAEKNMQGYYDRITMPVSCCAEAYTLLGRESKASILALQQRLVTEAAAQIAAPLRSFCQDTLLLLQGGKFPDFGIGKDSRKLGDVLLALEKIGQLPTETYVRNFSEAVFHHSKRFQEIQGSIERILSHYTPDLTDGEDILERYHLYQNPPYVYLKGSCVLSVQDTSYNIQALPGGLALPITALDHISNITLRCSTVISVENLTTYHDADETDKVVIYLGGFPNGVRVRFLRLLYQNAPAAQYFHRGDLDPYGFLILENLKGQTGIPFQPLEMDLATLRACYDSGHYRPLSQTDLKIMESPLLQPYQERLGFMKSHNCKVEQECFEAMKLAL